MSWPGRPVVDGRVLLALSLLLAAVLVAMTVAIGVLAYRMVGVEGVVVAVGGFVLGWMWRGILRGIGGVV